MIYGLLLAGGMGTRTMSLMPKQFNRPRSAIDVSRSYLSIAADKLILGGCQKIIICVPEQYLELANKLITNELNIEQSDKTEYVENTNIREKVIIIPGGAERIDSLRIGFEYIHNNLEPSTVSSLSCSEHPTRVVIHDAARPFVPSEDITRLDREIGDINELLQRIDYCQYITPITGGLILRIKEDKLVEDKLVNRNDYFELVTPIIICLSTAISILSNPQFTGEFIPILQIDGIGYKLITPRDPGLYRKITWPSDLE